MLRLTKLTLFTAITAMLGACTNDNRAFEFDAQSNAGAGGKGSGKTAAGGTGGAGAAGGTGLGNATCQLPVDPGTCIGSLKSEWRFAFNPAAGRCERFAYSSCGGNLNRFESLDDCILACDPGGLDRCSTSDDCTFGETGCCGSCEPYEKDSFGAVNTRYAGVSACNMMGVMCGPCWPYDGLPTVQNFGTQCVEGRCQVYDIREEAESACTLDTDCHLRRGLGCCPDCAAVSPWVAVNATFRVGKALCKCLSDCDLVPPSDLAARCTAGHCAVVAIP